MTDSDVQAAVQSTIEDLDTVTKRLKVSIPQGMVSKEIEDTLEYLAKSSKLKGFRDGKAPRQMVEKLHGNRIRMDVVQRLISTSLRDLLKRHKIEAVGAPEIDFTSFEEGKDLEYTAEISVFPSPEIQGYDSFEITIESENVTEERVSTVLDRIRDSKATFRELPFRTKVEANDVIDATFVVISNGQPEETPERVKLGLGSGSLPEKVESGLLGMDTGETREISVSVESEASSAESPAENVTYKVTLHGLSEKVLPEMTDEFVKSLESGFGTVLELRLDIQKKLEEESAKAKKHKIERATLEELLKRNEFAVPQVLVDDEIRSLLMRSGAADPKKVDIAKISVEPFREKLNDVASHRVRSAILVDRIAEKENIRADEKDIEETIARIAQEAGASVEEIKKYYYDKERIVRFVLEITRNKVLEFLGARAKVKEVEQKIPAS